MSHLKKYIEQMTNPELIGLAKNRFLDSEDQVAIAKWHYSRAHSYLIENRGLAKPARDILWDYKGYVKKCELICYGHYINSPDKYQELYNTYGSQLRSRSPWRLIRTFLSSSRWWAHGQYESLSNKGTPPEIIEDIYTKDVLGKRHANGDAHSSYGYYTTSPDNTEKYILENPNTSLDLIVKISASSPCPSNRNFALQEMANRS